MHPATPAMPLEQLGARLHQLGGLALMQDIEAYDPMELHGRLYRNRTAYRRLGISHRTHYREYTERSIFESIYRRDYPWTHVEYMYPAEVYDGYYRVNVYKNLIDIEASSYARDRADRVNDVDDDDTDEFDPFREGMKLKCTLLRSTLEPVDWKFKHFVYTRVPFYDSKRYIRVELEPRRASLAFARAICEGVYAEMRTCNIDPDVYVPPYRPSRGLTGFRPRTWSDSDNASNVGSDDE